MNAIRLCRIASLALWLACSGAAVTARPALKVDRVVLLMRHGVRAPLDGEVPEGTRSAAPWPRWPVAQSLLTDHGARAMTIVGASDRARWVRDGVLPAKGCPPTGTVMVRANTSSRTIASGEAYVRGLAPGCAIPVDHRPGDQVDPVFEPLRAGATRFDAAAAVASIERHTGGVEALARRHAPAIALLDDTLGCGLPDGCSPVLPSRVTPSADGRGIDLTGPIRTTSGTAQVLLLGYVEGLAPGDPDRLQRLGALHAALFDVMTRPPYMAAHQAAVLGRHMLAALTDRRASRLDVLVGHDTNVTALAAVLGVDLDSPGYATGDVAPGGALILERLRDPANGRLYVRAAYRAQSPGALRSLSTQVTVTPIVLPGCGKDGLCRLTAFTRRLRSRLADLRPVAG